MRLAVPAENPAREHSEESERLDQTGLRRVRSRGDQARRVLRAATLIGVVVLGFGIAVGMYVGRPSVPATVLVLADLLASTGGLVAHRFVSWAEVLTKNRSRRERGPGS